MTWELLIRRLLVFIRRHGWEGLAALLFAFALGAGIKPIAAGTGEFLDALRPAMAAQASDRPGQASMARIELPGFVPSHYAPQVLFPITGHLFPLWMELRGSIGLGPLPPPAGNPHGRPAIAICIDDLGEDLAGTDRAMALPREVALSFLPYADATPFLAQEAEAKGHDVLAHVPMEALSGTDPGPMTLKVGSRDAGRMLDWNISRVPGLKGVNNHEGSRFTQDMASLIPVMRTLAAKHLFFFDSRTGPESKGLAAAREEGVMSAGRDIFLDDETSESAVRAALDGLVAQARRDGVATAIGHPHDVTLKVLAAWLAENHGVELISLPEAIRRKSGSVTVAAK